MTRMLVLSFALLLAACTGGVMETPPAADAPGLYLKLGEKAGIERLVDALLAEVHNDLRINLLFEETDLPYLRERIIEQICQGSGGPCTYTGLSMEEAHSGMDISEQEFGWFVEDLNRAMAKVGLAADAQQELLGILGPMQPQVVHQ